MLINVALCNKLFAETIKKLIWPSFTCQKIISFIANKKKIRLLKCSDSYRAG